GIYYLILHKDISTFCGINYGNKDNKLFLIEFVEKIIDSYYGTAGSVSSEKKEIALSLLENGVDINIISKSTDLSVREIQKLKDNRNT
ncbi:MAG: hypothetical protein LBH12_03915, partial [Dysgonamonadaceae bacterium]|nr:hypothetical protein [Dysgonamonadaceae bacterium]